MVDAVSVNRKCRAIVKASITRLESRLRQLEDDDYTTDPVVCLELVRQAKTELSLLDSDFNTHHLALVHALENADELLKEQNALNEHDDHIVSLLTHLECLLNCICPKLSTMSGTPISGT